MRKPIVDAKGVMRLSYFEANDRLKKQALVPGTDPIDSSGSVTCKAGQPGVAWLGTLDAGDHHSGAIVNFSLTASGTGSVGIALEDLLTTNHSYMPATDLGGGDYRWFGVNYVCAQASKPPTPHTQFDRLFDRLLSRSESLDQKGPLLPLPLPLTAAVHWHVSCECVDAD
jgi:hypothetical protein